LHTPYTIQHAHLTARDPLYSSESFDLDSNSILLKNLQKEKLRQESEQQNINETVKTANSPIIHA
jgi:hypothetical protein